MTRCNNGVKTCRAVAANRKNRRQEVDGRRQRVGDVMERDKEGNIIEEARKMIGWEHMTDREGKSMRE